MRYLVSCRLRLTGILSILVSSLLISCSGNKPEMVHPFLIVKREQFKELRKKASEEPWLSMKADALARVEKGIDTTRRVSPYTLQDYVGAVALAYILDQKNSKVHAERVRDAILNQYSKLVLRTDIDWGGVVPPMSSFFLAILSLDIVYDDLSKEDIAVCEAVIESQIFKIPRKGSWQDVRFGTHGTWDIYKGVRKDPDDAYYKGIMAQITEDGVTPVTNHYAWERVGGGDSRISKSGYMDVLEFTGIDNRYYNDPKLQKFMRWLFGSSVNCSKELAVIGDMLLTQTISNDMLHRRVGNFDDMAAAYAAWFHEGVKAKGNIISYIIPKDKLPEPQIPVSMIYKDGGAFFREKPDNPDGLHSVLYNIKENDEWHTHNEVNSVVLSGYGNRLMVNGGRLGAPVRPAPLNNTLTIDGKNHDSRLGGGITEGFTGEEVDYACGVSGPSMSDDSHYRSLLLVHGSDGANAYAIVIDEVAADNGESVKSYFHPANQTSVTTVKVNEEYTAGIDHYPTITGSSLCFYYVTPPVSVNIDKVLSAVPDRYPGYPEHSRLESVYSTDMNGKRDIVTILFPFNETHEKATFNRISITGSEGCMIEQDGNVTDFVFESADLAEKTYEGTQFAGKSLLYRKINGKTSLFFVRKGTLFKSDNTGFKSDNPATIYLKNGKGSIISGGGKVTFYDANISAVNIDYKEVTSSHSDNMSVTISIPEGNHMIELLRTGR
jgi:hypothetical protein